MTDAREETATSHEPVRFPAWLVGPALAYVVFFAIMAASGIDFSSSTVLPIQGAVLAGGLVAGLYGARQGESTKQEANTIEDND